MRTLLTVRNCGFRMKVICPVVWENQRAKSTDRRDGALARGLWRARPEGPNETTNLAPTERADVRHRGHCAKDVHLVHTDAETVAHARAGQCIARAEPHRDDITVPRAAAYLGRPALDERRISPEEAAAERVGWDFHRREMRITWLVNGRVEAASRDCPECQFPVPDFRKSCFVCGCEVGRG